MDSIIKKFESELPPLEKCFINFPWEIKEAYARYLAETYKYVVHSTKLLEYAASTLPEGELKQCFIHHVEEEKGHERLAENDLKHLGCSPTQWPELEITKEIYDTIYRQIDTEGVGAIIGYALALEGLSARRCPEVAKKVEGLYGKKASTFLKLHGEVDPGHIEDSFEVLKMLDPQQLEVTKKSMIDSCSRYKRFLAEIVNSLAKDMNQAFIEPAKQSPSGIQNIN